MCKYSPINVLDSGTFVWYYYPAIAKAVEMKGVDTMIYRATSLDLPHFIDRYRTGNYGEDAVPTHIRCSNCGALVRRGDSYYILDESTYCMNCREDAEAHILRDVSDSYIYVL